ncbi:MAG: UDP-N-acetylglucosamine 2-epimerase (non-hydrolyzing) [Acidobacteriota bacterium]
MKVMTVLGTRPEIIRLRLIIDQLDAACDHVLVHTGQNYAVGLSDLFFEQLALRPPDHALGVRADRMGAQLGQILERTAAVLEEERPDRLLILGDTNSGLAALPAKRLGIPVFHMEAGNRCYDDRVPEEVNRRVIDHASDVWLPYTQRSAENLTREGVRRERIYVIGNPIYEVMTHYREAILASDVHAQLGLDAGAYFLVTLHRAENVDDPVRLGAFVEALERLAAVYDQPVVCSLHPRTAHRMAQHDLAFGDDRVRALEPFGFFDFVALERDARCVLSDSGTVQEECCLLRVPSVTLRDVTERPETVECGSAVLAGADPDRIVMLVDRAIHRPADWTPPAEYLMPHVAQTVVNLLTMAV